jgi:hypothetical protein
MQIVDPNQIDPEHIADHPMAVRGFDRLLTTQRPAVLANVRNLRRRHPDASPAEIIRILERHFLIAVTAGGAGVGASAVIPGVGTGIGLALTGVETAVFLEASALFAQSVTEIHGIAVTDPDRARTIVMAMMLGTSGADLVRQLAAQATGQAVPRSRFWGDVIGRNVPQAFMGPIADRVKRAFMARFARNTTTGAIGRIMPFGIGAVLGGVGSNVLGRKIIQSSRQAFGPPPAAFPHNLEPRARKPREPRTPGKPRTPLIPLRKQLPPGAGSASAGLDKLDPH